MQLLVTGGAGFIGSNFIYYLLEKHASYEIVCLDQLTYAGNLLTLQPVLAQKTITFIKGDISDTAKVDAIFKSHRFDIVVNFAAESHVDRSIKDAGIFLLTNIIGTQVLMDACRKYGVSRFHQVSTDEVYGDLPLDRPDLFFMEDTPIRCSSPYAASKASADLLTLAYYRTHKLPVTISRCSNNYGPFQFPEKLIPLVISRALSDEKIPVYGKGENVRDWLYVKDHCAAIDQIVHNGKIGEVYNIGGHNELTNIQVVKEILRQLNKPQDLITYVTDRPGHDLRYAIDPTKMQSELGWQPETDFKVGIRRTIDWYLTNQDWLQTITTGDYQNYYQQMYGWRQEM